MKQAYIIKLEEETLKNTNYRRVLYTAEGIQLVLMSIPPQIEIGEETHHLDQFIRIEKGNIIAVIDGKESTLSDGEAIIIPRGLKHNLINKGDTDVKLYSLYAPPEHKDGVTQPTKADEKEEHFDGVTSN